MKPKFIVLNLVLVAGVAGIAWKGKENWDASQVKRRTTLQVVTKPAPVPAMVPTPTPEAAAAAKYIDVAQKNLFSKDRNPQVIIDPPKAPEPPKPMPKLPVVYGVMPLPSGVKALMADQKGGASAAVKVGDAVGEFKVLALDTKRVTFGWTDKEITRNIDDLLDRNGPDAPAEAAAAAPAAGQQRPAAAAAANRPAAGPPPTSLAKNVEIGDGVGPSVKSCNGDTSPAGTVVDGYKKVYETNPFGQVCRWVKLP